MGKYSKEDYEFEKNKQALLNLAKEKKQTSDHQPVWALELEAFRKQKKKERFMMFGSICGILSLILSGLLTLNLYMKFIG